MLTSFLIRKRISPAIVNIQKAGFIVLRDEGYVLKTSLLIKLIVFNK